MKDYQLSKWNGMTPKKKQVGVTVTNLECNELSTQGVYNLERDCRGRDRMIV
jgi:hypothetical protein